MERPGYKDAYWAVPVTDYVDCGPELTRSLFDDPGKLAEDWRETLRGFRRDAQMATKEQEEVLQRAAALFTRLGIPQA